MPLAGGAGGAVNAKNGLNGGSGGGADGSDAATGTPGLGTAGQGSKGGDGDIVSSGAGGGGGGAGQIGGSAAPGSGFGGTRRKTVLQARSPEHRHTMAEAEAEVHPMWAEEIRPAVSAAAVLAEIHQQYLLVHQVRTVSAEAEAEEETTEVMVLAAMAAAVLSSFPIRHRHRNCSSLRIPAMLASVFRARRQCFRSKEHRALRFSM